MGVKKVNFAGQEWQVFDKSSTTADEFDAACEANLTQEQIDFEQWVISTDKLVAEATGTIAAQNFDKIPELQGQEETWFEEGLTPEQVAEKEIALFKRLGLAMNASELERQKKVLAGQAVLAKRYRGKPGQDARLLRWAKENKFLVNIAEPSDWANPFKIGMDGDRAAVIEQYREYLEGRPDLLSRIEELRGKVLACWCYPNPCHGNVLIDRLKTVFSGR